MIGKREKNTRYGNFILLMMFVTFMMTSCMSTSHRQYCSRNLSDNGVKSAKQLYSFFMANRPDADKSLIKKLAEYYVKEGATEHINSDCAFIQMCLETGWLRFGGLVTPDMHNYCGLGAMDEEHPGEHFATEQMGVRAHIQHLHAYATTENVRLKNKLIDPRYRYVLPRGKAQDIFGLGGTWAADKEYGKKLDKLLSRLEEF